MFDVLEALALAEEELSLTRLQAQLNLPLPTLHRLLQALVERGYVEQNGDSRRYGPGLRILEIAEAAKRNSRFDLCRVVRPFLQRLTDDSGESSNLVIRHDSRIVYVEQVPSPRSVRMFTEVGHRAPLYCTGAGKAILSCLSSDQLDAYVATLRLERLTPHTLASVDDLKRDISVVRQRGFALDNEEFEAGVRCVAAPIVDAAGHCVAAISVSGPTTRMSYERAEELGPQVRHISTLCSTQLGYGSSVTPD
jgi:IclR family acetate operon transcriptional repressor